MCLAVAHITRDCDQRRRGNVHGCGRFHHRDGHVRDFGDDDDDIADLWAGDVSAFMNVYDSATAFSALFNGQKGADSAQKYFSMQIN